ncbi:tRNA methyltransferase 10 homolog C-like [Ptychodera flava]|uniref:tRNA methyltransferase 10 homolog C-like n=1 Tax=Ptychodera flava TaxID=63121 RepID=UPI003969C007
MLRGNSLVAIRRIQTSILARHQKKVRPSSEVLQTLPDLYEIFESSHVTHKPPLVRKYSCTPRSAVFVSHLQVRSLCSQKPVDACLQNEDELSDEEATCENGSGKGDTVISSSEREKMLEDARQLVDMWRKSGKFVPEEVTESELEHFFKLETKSSRKKYLKFLARKEIFKRTDRMKKLRKAEEREKQQTGEEEKFEKNTIFLYIRNSTMANNDLWSMARGMRFGPKLIIDHSYEDDMTMREIKALVKQLSEVLGAMKTQWEPFHMLWTDIRRGGLVENEIQRVFGDYLDKLLIDTTDESFTDIFPREQLVYLSADSPNVLTQYDPNKVYIVGGMVDLTIRPRVSLAKAKRYNIASARLPLDHYMKWGPGGGKNLTVDQMVKIMLELKKSGIWQKALKHVPMRKIEGVYEEVKSPRYTQNRQQAMASRSNRQVQQQSLTGKFSFSRASKPVKEQKEMKENKQDLHGLWYGRTPYPEEQSYFTARRKGMITSDTIPPNFAEKYKRTVEKQKNEQYKQRRQIHKEYLKDIFE